MILHYFNKKRNKEKNIVNNIYSKILKLSTQFTQSENNYIIKKDFNVSFEVFTIFFIFYIKLFKDFKLHNYKYINEELIKLFINDLDYTLREHGISDMKIGKYVKKYVKKLYFRLSQIEDIFKDMDISKIEDFIKKLNFIDSDKVQLASKEFKNTYLNIQSSFKNNSILDNF